PADAVYATAETLNALTRAAALVAYDMPGGKVTINDLGLEHGGPIEHHGSHQAGRDVDVLFYLLDEAGEPMPGVGAPLDPEGRGTDFADLADPTDDVQVRIDLPRSWRYVAALIEDPDAHLQRIFLAEHLRTLLLAEAQRQGAAEATVARFADETCQPSYPHDDHFHFRFFCSAEDIPRGCRDSRPLYDWRREQLAEADVRPRLSAGRGRRAEVTTARQARRRAGRVAPEVRAFLQRRRAWMTQPHPHRPHCR
ncbi:MAG: penicillin-insensitive murein endopeptidase, partial [Deltaproteobacteria bacterium]|nr:penicillin-insensitive murein endopeptidase [Deltaproteobacteria bacterium]